MVVAAAIAYEQVFHTAEADLLVDETNAKIDGYNPLVLTSQELVDSLRPTSA